MSKLKNSIKKNPALYCIVHKQNRDYLNPNWQKKFVSLTISNFTFYVSLEIAKNELDKVNKIHNSIFEIITYYTIKEEELNDEL